MHLLSVSPEELEALGHTENSVCLGLNNKGSSEAGLLKNVLALNVLLCVSAHDVCVGGHAEVRGQLCRATSLLSSLLQAHLTSEPLHQPELGLCYGRLTQWCCSRTEIWGL